MKNYRSFIIQVIKWINAKNKNFNNSCQIQMLNITTIFYVFQIEIKWKWGEILN